MSELKQLQAKDLMTPHVHEVCTTATLREAAQLMTDHGVHCLMVRLAEANRGLGIITSKDVVQLVGEACTDALDELTVGEVMTMPAVCVPRELCLLDCINLMRMVGVRRVFVVEGLEPVGLLSFTDVLQFVADGTKRRPTEQRTNRPDCKR
jgi:CBS domain-containing protein